VSPSFRILTHRIVIISMRRGLVIINFHCALGIRLFVDEKLLELRVLVIPEGFLGHWAEQPIAL